MINAPIHTGLTQEGLSPPIGDWKMWIVKLWALQLENFSKRRIILKLKSIPKNSAKQIFKYVEKLILDWIRPVLKYYFFNWSQTQLIFSSEVANLTERKTYLHAEIVETTLVISRFRFLRVGSRISVLCVFILQGMQILF